LPDQFGRVDGGGPNRVHRRHAHLDEQPEIDRVASMFKHSGIGREHGRVGIEMYTELKSVCMFV